MNLVRASDSQNLLLENQAKLAEERLSASEEATAKINSLLIAFTKSATKYRDAVEELATTLHEVFETEAHSTSLMDFTVTASRSLTFLAFVRDQSTSFLHDEVFSAIDQYRAFCRTQRCRMKNICSSKEEASSRRRAAMIRRNDSESTDASCSRPLSHMQKALEDHILAFEKKKLEVMKGVLREFIKGETSFHVDAVRLLSETYSKVLSVDVENDFVSFRNALQEKRKAAISIRPSNSIVLRRRPSAVQDKFAFLDNDSLKRINERRYSERSSLATVPSDILGSANDIDDETDVTDDEETGGSNPDIEAKEFASTQCTESISQISSRPHQRPKSSSGSNKSRSTIRNKCTGSHSMALGSL